MSRWLLLAGLLLLPIAAGTSNAATTAVSPCIRVSGPMWSPDGTQIVYYGTRWPKPAHTSATFLLHAICTAKPEGTNVQPVQYTVCGGKGCPEPPTLIAWIPNGILYTSGGNVYRIVPGNKPRKIAAPQAVAYVANAAGTEFAAQKYFAGCMDCKGPVTIYDATSGAVVGTAGGTKYATLSPTLSPDGTQVAFERQSAAAAGKSFGIWAASVHRGTPRQLAKVGADPFWSPNGPAIAYLAPLKASDALRVVNATGGKSRTLVAKGVATIFGWSPDGTEIAFGTATGKLDVVDVASRKVRTLIALHHSPTAAWAPDSTQLVANSVTKLSKGVPACWATFTVPADGSTPTRISTC